MPVQNVKLIPLQTATKPWNVVYGSQSGDTPQTYPKVDVPKGSGPHLIVFELSGNHAGITFAATNPISVKAGSKPAAGSGSTDPQIAALPSADGKQLFVLDSNQATGQLHYALAFDGHANLDPIIDNGGRTFSFMSVEVLIAAAIFLTIGFLVRPMIVNMFSR